VPNKKTTTTAAIAIAGMLCLSAIANAAGDGGPQWPNLYEPKWPNVPGEPGYDPAKVTPAPVSEPQTTGSVNPVYKASPVAARWGEFAQTPAIFGEFGLRYVFSSNKTAKNLYDFPGGSMVSRLTYSGMDGHAAEGFGRVEHTSGFFLKGYVGAGVLLKGKLQDEDFPPGIVPYSSTDSRQDDGTLAYAAIDLGYSFIRQPGLRIGAFAGYHYLDQTVNAFGCVQGAGNTAICGGGGLPEPWKVISQNNHWNSLRVGLDAKIALGDRFSLSLDAAWLPYVKLQGADTHWLRIGNYPGAFTGPVPEDGKGTGYQLEAVLSYAVSKDISVAVGGRYWRMETSGNTHFEDHVVGFTALPQPVEWKVENLGVFVQGSFKFGPYPTGGL
jgi:outer membrane protease